MVPYGGKFGRGSLVGEEEEVKPINDLISLSHMPVDRGVWKGMHQTRFVQLLLQKEAL